MAVVANDSARQSAAVVTRAVDAMQRIEAFSTSVRPLAVYRVVMHPAKGPPPSLRLLSPARIFNFSG